MYKISFFTLNHTAENSHPFRLRRSPCSSPRIPQSPVSTFHAITALLFPSILNALVRLLDPCRNSLPFSLKLRTCGVARNSFFLFYMQHQAPSEASDLSRLTYLFFNSLYCINLQRTAFFTLPFIQKKKILVSRNSHATYITLHGRSICACNACKGIIRNPAKCEERIQSVPKNFQIHFLAPLIFTAIIHHALHIHP